MALICTCHTVSQADCPFHGSYATFNHPTDMVNTPTPRTDEFLGTLERHEGRIAWSIKDIEALVERARQLEQELNEALAWKQSMLAVESEWDEQKLASMLGGSLGQSCRKIIQEAVPKLVEERDQLRKICDELASTIYVHSLRPQNALDTYNQLPHVLERKTK